MSFKRVGGLAFNRLKGGKEQERDKNLIILNLKRHYAMKTFKTHRGGGGYDSPDY